LGLGSISNQTLSFVESNVGRGGAVTLVIGNNLDTIILPNTYARIGGSKVDSDRFSSDGCGAGKGKEAVSESIKRNRIGSVERIRT
jgi:hypothetical protein